MNFKSILALGLGIATLGVTLPARADTASVNTNTQTTVITGNNNVVNQRNTSLIRNAQTGGRTFENTGNVNDSNQAVDILGDGNRVDQTNRSDINNIRLNRRKK